MTTSDTPGAGIDYTLFLDCVHCGLCTSACPTYVELGDENDSPRGRIHLMRAVTDGRLEMNDKVARHLDLCLDCRACETACPSGVQYGRLIEPFRVAMKEQSQQQPSLATGGSRGWFEKYILFGLFPYASRTAAALMPARIAQTLRLDKALLASGLWRLLPSELGRMFTLLPPLGKTLPPLPIRLEAKGTRRATVGLFTGCVADAMFRKTHWATARVLQENGCDVVIPSGQVCCGAIHYHAGSNGPAREFADTNAAIFNDDRIDAVIVNVAGCGSMLKDYPHHWSGEGQQARTQLASKVKDVHEFLDEIGIVPPQGEINTTAVYHDACHLAHAQQITDAPRNLLHQIPGLQLRALAEPGICCGAAGSYNITEPDMADRLAARKFDNIQATGAQIGITANAGCLLQIGRESRMRGQPLPLFHPMDLLDRSYRGVSLDDESTE